MIYIVHLSAYTIRYAYIRGSLIFPISIDQKKAKGFKHNKQNEKMIANEKTKEVIHFLQLMVNRCRLQETF